MQKVGKTKIEFKRLLTTFNKSNAFPYTFLRERLNFERSVHKSSNTGYLLLYVLYEQAFGGFLRSVVLKWLRHSTTGCPRFSLISFTAVPWHTMEGLRAPHAYTSYCVRLLRSIKIIIAVVQRLVSNNHGKIPINAGLTQYVECG